MFAGGMSDRGYSSMTLDDAKRASIIIGSQDSIDSLSKPHGTKTDKRERPISKIPVTKERPKSNSANNDKGERCKCACISSSFLCVK